MKSTPSALLTTDDMHGRTSVMGPASKKALHPTLGYEDDTTPLRTISTARTRYLSIPTRRIFPRTPRGRLGLNATVFPGNHHSRVTFSKSRILSPASTCTLHNLDHPVSKFNHGSSPVHTCIVPCLTAQPPLDEPPIALSHHKLYPLSSYHSTHLPCLSHTPLSIMRYVHKGASSSELGRAEHGPFLAQAIL